MKVYLNKNTLKLLKHIEKSHKKKLVLRPIRIPSNSIQSHDFCCRVSIQAPHALRQVRGGARPGAACLVHLQPCHQGCRGEGPMRMVAVGGEPTTRPGFYVDITNWKIRKS